MTCSGKKILICDDDEGIVDVTRIVLTDAGYEVTCLTASDDIFQLVDTVQPDLILLDLWMPRISGEEITLKLKQDEHKCHIPIVIVSASRKTEYIARSIGADDFMSKPFDIEELETIVRKYTQA